MQNSIAMVGDETLVLRHPVPIIEVIVRPSPNSTS